MGGALRAGTIEMLELLFALWLLSLAVSATSSGSSFAIRLSTSLLGSFCSFSHCVSAKK